MWHGNGTLTTVAIVRRIMIHNLAANVPGFTSNVFLVEGDRPALVDVGNDFDVVSAVRDRTPVLEVVAMTHTHPDHVGNLPAVRDAFDAPVFGFDSNVAGVDRPIEDDQEITLGDHDYRAIHTPGHKNDHVCLYAPDPGILFAGDLVFQGGGFGRTDLEEGDRGTLIDSIERVLTVVDEDLEAVHVGHGPSITEDPYGQIELAAQAARL
jgi:glyoxylase-like metal-dependent hydrolase (beta-lactamase superfamily II)